MSEQAALAAYAVAEKIATITLDSPHNRNALSQRLVAEVRQGLAAASADPQVRAVVLTHTGTVFCAGADLDEAGTGSMTDATTAIMAMLTDIVELGKPVIARVTGHVRAGGMGIVGACDIVLATDTASFAFTEARIGVSPAIISLTTLDVMQPRTVARFYLTGETFDATVAAQAGLVTVDTTNSEVDEILDLLVRQLKETSPQGSAESKALLTAARRARLAADSKSMVELSARLFASAEAQEGIHAFLEKRQPCWRG